MLNLSVDVNRIVKVKYLPGHCIDRHSHEFFHYIYIINGSGEIVVLSKKYTVNKDDICLIPPGIQHEVMSFRNKGFETLDIKFSCENINIVSLLQQLPFYIDSLSPYGKSLARSVLKNIIEKDVFFKEMVYIKTIELLIYLIKMYNSNIKMESEMIEGQYEPDAGQTWDNDVFKKVILYIKENLNKKINVSNMAKNFNFNEAYFCTMFRKHFGMSPLQYIFSLKLSKAKELMLTTDMKISRISEEMGFDNMHYFSRLFKNKEGVSPLRYIEKMKKDIIINISEDFNYIPEDKYAYPQKQRENYV